MSIDGRVMRTEWHGTDCRIHLMPRLERDGHTWSCVGQDSLVIVDCTWEPSFGIDVWGNSGTVIIETTPQRAYERVGYGKLREKG